MGLRSVFLPLLIIQVSLGFDLDLATDEDFSSLYAAGRTFFLPIGAGGNGINASAFAAIAAALAAALTSLLTLVGLGLVVATNMDKKEKKIIVTHGGYGHGSGGGSHGSGGGSYGNHHSSYRTKSSYYSRMVDTLNVDWETLSLVDWMSILHETWTGFDPSDIECQKRFICEVHQNKEEFGAIADALVYYFSYLKYGTVLSLPEYVKSVLEEYVDAADKGNTMTRDCGDIYSYCGFSVKELIHKYSPKVDQDNGVKDDNDQSHTSDNDKDNGKSKNSYEQIVSNDSDNWNGNYTRISPSVSNAQSSDNNNNNNNVENSSKNDKFSHILPTETKNQKTNHFYYNHNHI